MTCTPLRWLLLAAALCAGACSEDTLAPQIARLRITPLLEGAQTALADPLGIDLGQVPLFGLATARFRLDNLGTYPLEVKSASLQSESGGTFTLAFSQQPIPPNNLEAEAGSLSITFSPAGDAVLGAATVELSTNGGEHTDEVGSVTVRGVGLFVGAPNIELCYAGACYPQAGDCSVVEGRSTCVLEPLHFGNVALGTSANQEVRLRNVPLANTCLAPPGSPSCTPVCQLVLDRNAAAHDLGLGLSPADGGFSIVGNVELPQAIPKSDPSCDFAGEIRLLIGFAAGATPRDAAATFVVESNDPDAAVIEVPVTAAAREGPVAVAELLACDEQHPPPSCSDASALQPLQRVYLYGGNSYDPRDPDNPLLIDSYAWTLIEWPDGANPLDFAVEGAASDNFSMWMPLAGRYVARLQVRNDVGVQSGVSATSDVSFTAIPASRLHLQLTWDNAGNDQDLHFTYASRADLVCDEQNDCYWGDCTSLCLADPDCTTTVWFDGDAPLAAGNPRLDIDDTNGLGPENINIDAPKPGRYRVYVHYYGVVNLDSTPTRATLRIFLDGLLRGDFRRQLQRNQLWRIAEIEWLADGTATVLPATSDGVGPGQVTEMIRCTEPFDFGPWY